MNDLIVTLMFDWRVNLFLIVANVILYLMNYFLFKLKKEYKGFHWQMFLVLLAPCLNVIFFMFNCTVTLFCGSGYRVVKPKRRRARTGHTVKA